MTKEINQDTLYDILGVSLEASDEDIRKAYRREALKWYAIVMPIKHMEIKDFP
jgi:preprotein translocase subunit Sec63